MGEMAEYYDELCDWPDEYGDTVEDLMGETDAELVARTAKARSPKIKSIRQQSIDGKALSEKQRLCLAFWIEERR